jgi:putative thioredoxin
MLERLAIEGGGAFRLAKVNVDENGGLATRYGVQGIPAVKAFRQGKVQKEFVGSLPEPMVRRFLKELVPDAAAQEVDQARSLLATRHWPEAEAGFRAVLEKNETSSPAALGLIETLLWQGKGAEAKEILAHFPPGNEWARAEQLKPLAEFLSDVEAGSFAQESDPRSAALERSGRLIARGNLEAAMDGLLEILRQDKDYRRGLPRRLLVALFALLGDSDPRTRQYRDELASVLF